MAEVYRNVRQPYSMFRKSGYVSASKCARLIWVLLRACKLTTRSFKVSSTTGSSDRSLSTAHSEAFYVHGTSA